MLDGITRGVAHCAGAAKISAPMKIATWNVNGIRARFEEVVAFAETERPDVMCLQEIKAAQDQVPDGLFGLADYYNYWHGAPGGYSGVSLHVRRGAFEGEPEFSHPAFDIECRIVEVTCTNVVVASVYVPNGNKDFGAKLRFLDAMRPHVEALLTAGRELVLCGDLNVTRGDNDVTPKDRKPGAMGQRREERERFEAILDAGLVDVMRARSPDDDALFTWWPPWREMKQKNRGWRIDYTLVSRGLYERVTRCEVLRSVGTSDHGPVVLELA
jgi:exodeoxyribonuclease-3